MTGAGPTRTSAARRLITLMMQSALRGRQSRARRSHEQTSGNANNRADRVPEHSRAGVKGRNSVIAGAIFLLRGRKRRAGSRAKCHRATRSSSLSIDSRARGPRLPRSMNVMRGHGLTISSTGNTRSLLPCRRNAAPCTALGIFILDCRDRHHLAVDGTIPATSQLDWPISITAISVASCSRVMRDLLKSFSTDPVR